jgi:hypothetical protein
VVRDPPPEALLDDGAGELKKIYIQIKTSVTAFAPPLYRDGFKEVAKGVLAPLSTEITILQSQVF